MTFSTRNFDPLTPLAPKFSNFAIQILLFRLKHTVAVVTHAHVLQIFLHHMGTGCCLPKTTFRTKIGGQLLGQGSIQKFGTPYVFLQPLKIATSNLVHNLGLGLAYQKTRRGSGPGEHPKKIWDPSSRRTVFCNSYLLTRWRKCTMLCYAMVTPGLKIILRCLSLWLAVTFVYCVETPKKIRPCCYEMRMPKLSCAPRAQTPPTKAVRCRHLVIEQISCKMPISMLMKVTRSLSYQDEIGESYRLHEPRRRCKTLQLYRQQIIKRIILK